MSLPLHNDTREHMMSTGHIKAAMIADCLYWNNYNPGETFSNKDLRAVMGSSEYLVREGLKDRQVFQQTGKQTTGHKGRPAVWFIVPDRDVLRDRFVPGTEHGMDFADNLAAWAYGSQKDYRLAHMLAVILRRQTMVQNKNNEWSGFSCPTAWWTDRLGVTASTVRKYKRILNVESIPQFQVERVTEKTLDTLPEEGKPFCEFLVMGHIDDIAAGQGKRAPLMRQIARRWLNALTGDVALWRVRQLASLIGIPPNVVMYAGNGMYEDWSSKVIAPTWGMEAAA